MKSSKPVVSVCAVRTGSGKSQTTRRVSLILRDLGYKVAAIRHPMPYGDLVKQAVQRFADYSDLDKHECTIEEREEYEPHLDNGVIVYAGVDYERFCARLNRKWISYCGTAETMTSPSTSPTWRSWWPTRTARVTR